MNTIGFIIHVFAVLDYKVHFYMLFGEVEKRNAIVKILHRVELVISFQNAILWFGAMHHKPAIQHVQVYPWVMAYAITKLSGCWRPWSRTLGSRTGFIPVVGWTRLGRCISSLSTKLHGTFFRERRGNTHISLSNSEPNFFEVHVLF